MDFNINDVLDEIQDFALDYSFKIIGAVVVLFIGYRLIKFVVKTLQKYFDKKDMNPTVETFILSMTVFFLKLILIVLVLSILGVQMTSFIAILGAAGFAIGMALSGTLQNFAGGIVLLVLKPFQVGDVVEVQGFIGTIDSILLFHTILITSDNKKVILPNGPVSSGSLTNYNVNPTRRVDWKFGIAYGDDFAKAKSLLLKFISEDNHIHSDPNPFIALSGLSDSSVDISVRVWVDTPSYWAVFFAMNERVYTEFPKNGLSIPFPQMDVNLYKIPTKTDS